VKRAAYAALLLLASCGSSTENEIEPVPQQSGADSNQLLGKAADAAGNAQARMSAEAGNTTDRNSQGEMKR
jgi:hypothetical protein